MTRTFWPFIVIRSSIAYVQLKLTSLIRCIQIVDAVGVNAYYL